ncbi:polysaccharide biosynthesis tyrosine autokinase [Pleurocapsa sp. PCC 7319]|uniref:GumC family protein n=1 Tax=Pleurocapsa sp. PCC 7319 TaxID=118161 RepID=UPI00034A5B47|nr:polysaccharide biosynthesis tyrosine autokinase [Pleurocapsa sp. PCC 7319]
MSQNNWELEELNDLGYGQLFATLWRRRYWFAGVFGAVLAIAIPTALMKKPVYQSYMQVLAESNYQSKDLTNRFSDNAYLEKEFADSGLEIDYATQLKVLKSSELLKRAIAKLGLENSEETKQEIIESLRESLSVIQLTEEEGSQDPTTTKIIQADFIGDSPVETKRILEAIQEVYLEYNLEQQEKRLKDGLNFINNQIPDARRELTEAEAALTKLSKEHNLISPEQEAIALKENIREISKEREALKAQQSQTTGNYSNLQQQLNLPTENAQTLSRLSQSERYQNLLNELQQIEISLANEQTKFTNDNPIIQDLTAKRDSQRALLIQEAERVLGKVPANFPIDLKSIQKQRQFFDSETRFLDTITESQASLKGIHERELSLAQTEAELRQRLVKFPDLIARYRNLSQEAEVKRNALQRLLEAKQELEIELSRGGFGWQVIESPQLGEQIAPNLLQDLLLSFVIASFLGVGTAFTIEALDQRITNPQEIERQTSLPILGTTPGLSSFASNRFLARLPFLSQSHSTTNIKEVIQWHPFRESLDLIYQNLKLASINSPLQSLAVTSAIAGEGKSTLILGLAISAARHQQRVLVIDADLRRPSLHKAFNLANHTGLADFLAGEVTYPVIEQVSFSGETIDLIPSGSIPLDPVKLLNSSILLDLIDQQKQNYDLILVDTPPAIGMVDAIKVASNCDSAVLTMRLDKLKASELLEVEALFSKLNVLGIVINDSKEYEFKSPYLLPQQV